MTIDELSVMISTYSVLVSVSSMIELIKLVNVIILLKSPMPLVTPGTFACRCNSIVGIKPQLAFHRC